MEIIRKQKIQLNKRGSINMPKISKIRITNAQLDNGDKTFGNKIWDLRDNNTLFLLENGGGKTSVIQMIHQVITPNIMIQKRKIHDTLMKGKTAHIAIEWTPDDEERSPFITGFTLYNHGKRKSAQDSRDYDYISYIYEIEKENYIPEELPFISDGEVTSLYKLEELMKRSPGVMTFKNEVGRYTEALKSHGIFQSEWLNIAKINGGEGGIQEFFDDAKTVPSLISKLFVPSLEDNLYDEDERDSVADSFREHKDALLSLPQMERMLEDLKVVTNQSEDIIQASEAYGQTERGYKNNRYKMGSYHKTIENEVNRIKSDLDDLDDKIAELGDKRKKLSYAVDSYPIYTEKDKKEKNENKKEEMEEQVEKNKREINFYDGKIKEELGLKNYRNYARKNKQLIKEATNLKLMDMNNDERNRKFRESYKKVSSGNSYLRQQEQKDREQSEGNLDELKQTMKHQSGVQAQKEEEQERALVKLSELDAFVNSYEKEREGLIYTLSDYWKGNEEYTLTELKKGQESNNNRINHIEAEEKNIGEKRITLSETKAKLQVENKKIAQDETADNQKLDNYYEKRTDLNESLSVAISMDTRGKLFNIKNAIEQKMFSKFEKNEEKLFNLNVRRQSIETDIQIVQNDGFYVHPELKKMKEDLYMKGLDLVLGTEYLLSLDLTRSEKERMVRVNPLITFSIIVEESEVAKLNQAVSRMKSDLSIPVFFLKRESLANSKEKGNFFALNDDNYVLQRFESLLVESDWDRFKEVKSQELQTLSIQIEELKLERMRYENINEKIKQFYQDYHSDTEKGLLANVDLLNNKLEKNKKTIEECNVKIAELEERAGDLSQEKEETNEKIKQDDRLINRLEDFLERYETVQEEKEAAKQVRLELDDLRATTAKLKNQLGEFQNQERNIVIGIEGNKQILNTLDNERENFRLEKVDNPVVVNREQYESDLEILKQRENEISTEESQKQEIRERINILKEEMEEFSSEIKKLGYEIAFFRDKNQKFDQRMLEEYEMEKKSWEEELNTANIRISDLESEQKFSDKLIQRYLNDIQEKYGEAEEFLYDGDPKVEYDYYSLELKRANEEGVKLAEEKERLTSDSYKYKVVLDNIENVSDRFTNKDLVEEMKDDEWDRESPQKTFIDLENANKRLKDRLIAEEDKIQKEINHLMSNIKETKNDKLISMARNFKRFLDQSKLNYNSVIDNFYKVMETTSNYRKSYELSRQEAKKSEDEVVEIMKDRSEALYNSIKEIQKNSIVDFSGERKPTVKIRWERESDEDTTINFKSYIAYLINTIIDSESKEVPGKEIEAFIDKEMRMDKILNCYARLDKCNLEVWKPRNDILSSRITYDHWDKASNWSGGGTSSFKVTMFIAFNNLLRKKKTSKENTSKVLIMDNPFGKVSSKHVITPMVDLAKKTNTQLFCLTDINNEAVLSSFDTIISNKYISHLGRAALHSEITYKGPELDSLVYSREL